MSGLFSALGSLWTWLSTIFDPLCGPAGLFTVFGQNTMLACGDTGWGDELAGGLKVTIAVAVLALPLGLVIGFFVALAQQSEEKSLRLAAGVFTTIFRGLPELLTLFIIYYGMQILLQSVLARFGYNGPIEINAFAAGMFALAIVFSAYCSEVLVSAFKAIPKGQYEAGDALGVRPLNSRALVEEWLAVTGLDADTAVEVNGAGEVPFAEALSRHLDITRVSPDLLREHIRQVKTGLPGMAYVRLDPNLDWPANLQVKLPQ